MTEKKSNWTNYKLSSSSVLCENKKAYAADDTYALYCTFTMLIHLSNNLYRIRYSPIDQSWLCTGEFECKLPSVKH